MARIERLPNLRLHLLLAWMAHWLAIAAPAQDVVALPALTVTTTADSGKGSLRSAIEQASSGSSGARTIEFDIDGPGPHIIQPFNGSAGVWVESDEAKRFRLLGNSIHSNGGLSIDIKPEGPDANDIGDTDTGPNERQNHPELESAVRASDGLLVHLRANTGGPQTVSVEFFASPTCGAADDRPEARDTLGQLAVPLDSSGIADAEALLPILDAGLFVAATMNDAAGNTSELSPCVEVEPRPRSDVDCDDKVDAVDAIAVLRALAGYTTGTLPQTCAIDPIAFDADVDDDGSVTVLDVLEVRCEAAGLGSN